MSKPSDFSIADEVSVPGSGRGCIERLCALDGILHAPAARGIDRIEARFRGSGYSLHRHDTYALGITLSGVQTFAYRGESRFSVPGNVIVIHPDETHDGGAGGADPLRYRMLYLPPACVIEASGGQRELPFVQNPVFQDAQFHRCLHNALINLDEPPSNLMLDSLVETFADLLWRHADTTRQRPRTTALRAVLLCRDYLYENCDQQVTSKELEQLCGLDRYMLARQFRSLLGTSPHRYLLMRRLEKGRTLMKLGSSPAEIAAACGFADQSHFIRLFRKAFGMTPGRWLSLTKAATSAK